MMFLDKQNNQLDNLRIVIYQESPLMTPETTPIKIFDQSQFWNRQHSLRLAEFASLAKQPTAFAEQCVQYLSNNSKILELGCANGRDASYFVRSKNCQIVAVDISFLPLQQQADYQADEIANISRVQAAAPCLPFNMTEPYFDAFYARSAIYLEDKSLILFLKKIKTYLKTGGYFMLQGKTTSSDDIAASQEIGKNLVKDDTDHIRRVWELTNTLEMFQQLGCNIIDTDVSHEQWSGQNKEFISIIAQKK